MRNFKNNEIYSDLPLVVSRRTLQELLDISEKDDSGDERRTVTRRAGSGKLSKLAKDVSGLAKSDPDSLLQVLNVLDERPGGDKQSTIAAIFNKIITSKIDGDMYFQYLFDSARVTDKTILLRIIEYACDNGKNAVVAVSPRTCGSIVSSILYAMATSNSHQKITWDESKGDKVEIRQKTVIITVAS